MVVVIPARNEWSFCFTRNSALSFALFSVFINHAFSKQFSARKNVGNYFFANQNSKFYKEIAMAINIVKSVVDWGFIKKKDRKLIADLVFKLHYFVSASIFGACAILSIWDSHVSPITCHTPGVKEKILDNFCWIQGTFTLPKDQGGPHHGVGAYQDEEEVKYHAWYQWASLMLMGQAWLFYFPFHIWKSMENGHMERLVQGLKSMKLQYMFDVDDTDDKEKVKFADQRHALVRHFAHNLGRNNAYAGKYVLMEVANLVNIGFQIYMMNVFLGGEFYLYGLNMLWYITGDYGDRADVFKAVRIILLKRSTRHLAYHFSDFPTSD